MLRRSLFWGLTLVLIVALTVLIIRGCRLEKKQARQLVETVEEAKPTSTRVFAPRDLKIVQSKMELETKVNRETSSQTALHEVEIYNGGNVSYREIQLKFVYLSRGGKELEVRIHPVVQTIPPGSTVKLANIEVDNIPSSAAILQTTIIYADIGPSTRASQ